MTKRDIIKLHLDSILENTMRTQNIITKEPAELREYFHKDGSNVWAAATGYAIANNEYVLHVINVILQELDKEEEVKSYEEDSDAL